MPKIGLAQISMSDNIEYNLQKTLDYITKASKSGCDLVFFPEVQLSPFFPQYVNKSAQQYLMSAESAEISAIQNCVRENNINTSINIYYNEENLPYDASFMLKRNGEIGGISKMVHIMQAENFYECDYYTPSNGGFEVYDTDMGRVGIVICFDRHLPESIRTCAVKGAQLVIIPTANVLGEPVEMYEWELRVQAMQNNVYIAMCNRVGKEDKLDFYGESVVIDPYGNVVKKADDKEQLLIADLDFELTEKARNIRPYINLRRCEKYE
jgi:N-carbamoylputrescine amidase